MSPEHFCDPRILPGECLECLGAPRPFVALRSWAGFVACPVEVIGRTAKRLRVRFLANSGGRRRGEVRLVAPEAVHWPTWGAQ